ncbi:Sister chromatid cohesion protein 2 [Mortierella sp. GBA30]|nr:Sister chromatid cohesion protein 2 [Mortierella sp. GBA30]
MAEHRFVSQDCDSSVLQQHPTTHVAAQELLMRPQQMQPLQPQIDGDVSSLLQPPHNAQSGLQYTALASITSTDSVLRDLPSLSVAFPEFRLAQLSDPTVQTMLAQDGLTPHAIKFQSEYLKAIVANANVDNIRFQPASQITASKEDFTPQFDRQLSSLAESVLAHCSHPNMGIFDSGNVYQLPRIDPYTTLVQFKQSVTAVQQQISASSQALSSIPSGPSQIESNDLGARSSNCQKRNATEGTDDDRDGERRASKKIKSLEYPDIDSESMSRLQSNDSSVGPERSPDSSTPTSQATYQISASTTTVPIATRTNAPVQESDPASAFEDSVAELMERVDNADESFNGNVLYLSPSELKYLAKVVEDLSKQGLLVDIQHDSISLLLRYLDSSMNQFDAVDVFSLEAEGSASTDQDRMDTVIQVLNRVTLSLEHISLSLIILNGKGLQQHLFPEELLLTSLNVFKSHIERFLAPALEFSKDDGGISQGSVVFKTISQDASLKTRMLTLVSTTCEISEKLRRLGNSELSDNIIVKLVYIGLALFFIDTSSELIVGLTEAESLKQAGSRLLRMIYAKCPNQRMWILEEILSLLIKLPHGKKVAKGYRLVDGCKIHASSALLMQLVHTCTESPLLVAPPLEFLEMPRSTQMIEMRKLLDGVKTAMESAKSSVGYIFNFLLSRCTKGTKSSLEAEYRMVLDSLVTDLLTVLGQPEWPSAELCLFLFSKAMAKYLDDPKADFASRTMAIDSLGLIAAKIKTISNQLAVDAAAKGRASTNNESLPFYGQLSIDTQLSDLLCLQASYSSVVEYLGSNEINDSAVRAAKDLWVSQWSYAICSVTSKNYLDRTWEKGTWELLAEEAAKCWSMYSGQEWKAKSRTSVTRIAVCQSAAYLTSRQQLFLSFDMLLSRILSTLEGGAVTLRAKSLKALSLIVTGDYGVLAQQNVRRTIALRLQDQSPSVRDAAIDLVGKYMLRDATIRKAYYEIDTGLNVRKRVLRLLKDMFHKVDSAVRNDISKKLLLRVNDDETTVKNLAIRSVSDVWLGPFIQATGVSQGRNDDPAESQGSTSTVTSSQKRDVSQRARTLVGMIGQLSQSQDEAFESVIQHLLKKERGDGPFSFSTPSQEFTRTCVVIVDTLVDLIQTLQEEDAPKSAVISTVHTLHTFIKAEPRLVGAKHLTALLAYLHCSSTSEDWRITMFVLKIYQNAIPVIQDMTLNDSLVAEKLTLAMIAKCPVILLPEVVSTLCLLVRVLKLPSMRLCKFHQTCVGLLSGDVERLQAGQVILENKTRRLMTIVGLFCRHFPFDEAIQESPDDTHFGELKTKMRPTVHEFVFDILHSLFLGAHSRELQQTALQSLGHIYLSFPALMNSVKSTGIMDSVFEGHDNELKVELLHIYTNYLLKIQTTPASDQGKGPGYSLIAKAEDHLEAGIGSSIMQRYLDGVLQCALVDDRRLQTAAVDVITQVTLQALAHPMLCMPAIVALESSDDHVLSERVFKIHQDMHQKHASLIYSRSMDCIRTMYIYQKRVQGDKMDTQGHSVIPETGSSVALLSLMYSLVSDKRQARNALLSGLVKVLDVDLASREIEIDGSYARFIAENLAYLEYRTMEEVYLVIFYLNRIIAGSGMTLLVNLTDLTQESTTHLCDHPSKKLSTTSLEQNRGKKNSRITTGSSTKLGSKKDKTQVSVVIDDASGEDSMEGYESGEDIPRPMVYREKYEEDREPVLPTHVIAKASVAVELVMVLKSHLKRIYDISEVKSQQFQPGAHATHKERPVPRFTGAMARINWPWKTHEIDKICGLRSGAQELARKQIERFRVLIEAETVQAKDEDMEPSRHHHSDPASGAAGLYRGLRAKTVIPLRSMSSDGDEEDEADDDEEEEEDDVDED